MDPDLTSKRLRNLTNHPGGDYRPAWSADGQWLAFTSDRDSDGARASTPAGGGRPFSAPQTTELYAVRADGTGLRRLTDSDASVGGAAWSRDGARLVFYEASAADWRAMNSDLPGPFMATSQVVTLDPATGARAVLTSGPVRRYQPKWVGDGVVYTRGGVHEQRGVRERVNYVAHGISFTDGRKELPGAYSNVNWSPTASAWCSTGPSKARGRRLRRRSVAIPGSPLSAPASFHRTRPTAGS